MDKDHVIAKVKEHADEIRALGVTELYLFGSTVRGEAGDTSDVDFFIEYDRNRKFSLLDLIGVQMFLDDLLGTKTDVGTKSSLHPLIKDEVLAEAEQVI